ncbi:MAG: cupin domain-containing protein [Clostridia bacterium]|nr:cupin domain-containing protein [Clostridia bacterium]
MEFIRSKEIVGMKNPGVVSRQLINPGNSASTRVTMTEVHLQAAACQPRHIHEASEQIWYALRGQGKLLLADGEVQAFCAGDVVRFEAGDVHGLENDGDVEFVYLSVTAPPIHFGYAYESVK